MKRSSSLKKNGFPSFFSGLINTDTVLERDHSSGKLTEELLTLLPLRELVLFPNTIVPVFITNQPGMSALDQALRRDKRLFAVYQKKQEAGSQNTDDMWPVGTAVRIVQHLKLPDNTFRVVLQGEYRGRIRNITQHDDYSLVKVAPLDTGNFSDPPSATDIALLRTVQKSFTQYAELSKKIGSDTLLAVERADNPERLANLVCNSAQLKPEEKIELIAIPGIRERLEAILETLERENEIVGIQKNISGNVKNRIDKNQREYYLHEQLKEINKELGKDKTEDDFSELEKQIQKKEPPSEVLAKT
jgi:ATP-dependent Lon protease